MKKVEQSQNTHELKSRKLTEHNAKMEKALSALPDQHVRSLRRGTLTGSWLSVLPSVCNGTTLSPQEFWDALCMRHDIKMPDPPVDCDGCNAKNLITHALGCKKGGIVTLQHDGIANTLAHLGAQAFKPSAMHDEPHIRSRAATPREVKAIAESMKANKHAKNKTPPLHDSNIFTANRGDVAIASLWHTHTDCIIDATVTNTEQESCLKLDPAKVLSNQEKSKKAKCLEPCLAQRRHFSPFVVSVNGMFGHEATTVAKCLAVVLATK